MKTKIFLLIFGVSIFACADRVGDINHAKRYGANARIVLRCVDQDGNATTNANVSSALYPDGSFENAIVNNGTTDTNGCFVMEGKTNGEFSYSFDKRGYYKTREDKYLFKDTAVFVSNGRWQPYGATNTVVLKRIVNPVAMYIASSPSVLDITMPVREVSVGFDLEKCDWISPYGNGVNADVQFKHEFRQGKEFLDIKSILAISFTNAFSGAYVMEKDSFSAFPTVYEVNTNANFSTEHRFVYDRRPEKVLENSFLPSSKYLVFRCRTKVDKDGNLISSRYGKIYGDIDINRKGRIRITYYLNPNENDTNLEADTTKNLLPPHRLGFSP